MKFFSPNHYDQDHCSRCEKKCKSTELIGLVCRAAKSTHILMICEKCTISFCKWLDSSDDKLPTWKELRKSFKNSLSDDTKEEMR